MNKQEKSDRTRLNNLLNKYHNKIYFKHTPKYIPIEEGKPVSYDINMYISYPKEYQKEIIYALKKLDWSKL